MPRCNICLQEYGNLKYRTGRLSICAGCVEILNDTHLSPREAEQIWLYNFRDRVRLRYAGAPWVEGWLANNASRIIEKQLKDPSRVAWSLELKILRAHRSRIICLDRKYLNYPADWEFRRYQTKHWHNYSCYECGDQASAGTILHVHHIISRSKSGTNSYRNLVVLCFNHHQREHAHPISAYGGESGGTIADEVFEEIDPSWGDLLSAGVETSPQYAPDSEFTSAEVSVITASRDPRVDQPRSRVSVVPNYGSSFNAQLEVQASGFKAEFNAVEERNNLELTSSGCRELRGHVPREMAHEGAANNWSTGLKLPVGLLFAVFLSLAIVVNYEATLSGVDSSAPAVVTSNAAVVVPTESQIPINDDESARASYAEEYAKLVREYPEVKTDLHLADEIADERDRLISEGNPGNLALRLAASRVFMRRAHESR